MFLRMPLLPWVTRQALPHGPLNNYAHKHRDTGPLLPDFSLQNTCKFAAQSVAWTVALKISYAAVVTIGAR